MDSEIIDLLRTVASSFQTRIKEKVAAGDSGLSAFQARLVNLIGRNDGVSQLTLTSLTERDKAQVARAIKELETAGFVTRSPQASDRRSKCLTLTPQGREMHLRLNGIRRRLAADAFGVLDDDEKQALRCALQKVATRLRSPG